MVEDAPSGDRDRLTELITRRLAEGSLPRYAGQRTFGGRGEGVRCGCCDRPIGATDIQYDVDQPHNLADVSDAASGVSPITTSAERTIPMHLPCYRLWVEVSGGNSAGSSAPPTP